MATICFSHGKESGPVGTKILAMSAVAEQAGHQTLSIDYRGIDEPEARVEKLLSELDTDNRPLILVGSSMGGFVSIVASTTIKPDGLFLMAPAVYLDGYNHIELTPVAEQIFVIQGWHDEIVPCENVIKFSQKHSADLYLCNDGHTLAGSIELIKQQFSKFLSAYR